VGLDQGRQGDGLHQSRNPAPFRDPEIHKAAHMARIGATSSSVQAIARAPLPVRWRAALVCACSVAANGGIAVAGVTKLHGAGRLFACRHCYRLAYASQRGSACRQGREITKIRMRLAEARTCLRSSPTSRRACTGGPTSDSAPRSRCCRGAMGQQITAVMAQERVGAFLLSDPACCAFITPW
jgi:hypothetical protein